MEMFTRNLRSVAGALAAAVMMTATGTALAQSPATIPAGLEGTYALTYGMAQPGSPLANGTTATMVIAPGGTVCIADYLLVNPVTQSGNMTEAVWGVPTLGAKLVMANIASGTLNKLDILSTNNQFLGRFTFNKVSNATFCEFLGGVPQNTTTIADIFRLAELQYGELFPGMPLNSAYQIIDGYIAREYVATGTAIGIRNGTVYVQGGEFGNAPVTIGTLANTLAMLTGGEPVEEPVVEVPEGDYDLTISGTATSMGISTPLTITIEDMPAPNSTEANNLESDVRAILDDVEGIGVTTFADFQVSEISVSDSRVFFRTRFNSTSVTATPIGNLTTTVAYNLTFEFLKN